MIALEDLRIEIEQVSRASPPLVPYRFLMGPALEGEPEEGPSAGESFLASVAACFMNHVLAEIRSRKLPVHGVRTAAAGKLGGDPPRFVSIELTVSAAAGGPGALREAVDAASRASIAINTLRTVLPVWIHVE